MKEIHLFKLKLFTTYFLKSYTDYFYNDYRLSTFFINFFNINLDVDFDSVFIEIYRVEQYDRN